MNEGIKGVFERKESLLKQILETSSEIKTCALGSADASKHLDRKKKLLSELSETDSIIAAMPSDKRTEIPEKIVVNINSLLIDLIKTEKETESIISSKLEHLRGNHINAYKKLDKNS